MKFWPYWDFKPWCQASYRFSNWRNWSWNEGHFPNFCCVWRKDWKLLYAALAPGIRFRWERTRG